MEHPKFVLCDSCGVDWVTLIAMLREPKGTDNWEMAQRILGCPECREFADHLAKVN